MSSTIKKQLAKVEQHIIHGEFQEALSVIEVSLKKKTIIKEEELNFLLQKSLVLFYLGNIPDSLQLAQRLYKETEKIDNDLLKIDAIVRLLVNSNWVGRFSEALEIADKGLSLLTTTKSHPKKELALRKAQLLIWKAGIIGQLGDFDKCLELTKEALASSKESGYKHSISFIHIQTGSIYLSLDDKKRAEEYFEKGIEIASEIGNKFFIANGYQCLAAIKSARKEYKEAIDLYEKSFALSKEIGSTLLLGNINDLGLIYRSMFQLDKALECFQDFLRMMPRLSHIAYLNIGINYFWKNDFQEAQKHFLKSLQICEEVNDRRILPQVLYQLIWINIELENLSQSQQYLNRLKEISEETGFDYIRRSYRFATIAFLKSRGNISDLGQAVTLLEEFLKDDELPSYWRFDGLFILLEIRLKELQLSPIEEAMKEVQKRLHHLEVEAEEQQLRWFLVNVYRLQSQLALIELDPQKAIGLLEKAQVIAEEIDVEFLKTKIQEDQEKIEQQLNMWQNLQEQHAPLSETVKLVSLENTVKSVKQETVLEERDKESGKIIEYRKLFVLKL